MTDRPFVIFPALQDFEPTGRNGTADCLSALQTTSTPEASTVFHTVSVTRTSTTTRNVTLTSAPSTRATVSNAGVNSPYTADEPWKRWLVGRKALAKLADGSPSSAPLAYPADAPSYASECGSPSSYVSACSCLGVTPALVTASPPLTTSTVLVTAFTTSTSIWTRYANSTAWRNATRSALFPNSTTTSESASLRPTSTSSTTSGRMANGRSSSRTRSSGSSDSSGSSRVTATSARTETPKSAGAPFANVTMPVPANSTLQRPLNDSSTSAKRYPNSTLSSSNSASTRASPRPTGWSAFPNVTTSASAPFANTTSPPFANSTTGRFQNSTMTATVTLMNATAAPFLNTTAASRFRNATTAARYWNTTAPAMNTTTPRFLNTSTPTTTPSSTATIDRTCGETAAAFGLTASQPSADAAAASSLACAATAPQGMRNWMACGLQVTISSSGSEADYDGVECKRVQLLRSGGNGTRNGSSGSNGTVARMPATVSLGAGGSSTRGVVPPTGPGFADVRRRQQGWGFLLGPFFGLGSEDGDL
ncbi:hypothetical protein MAPG_05054 [Magnaporthiopsis poae ATCC 64411]|uniref:Uncharacterized protein n=1 Tax=Magnaporthiopsis poae (strain ATCC 64411 / 73-15) TaxID=644358 RepID=A0A0C4DYD6_MAGP6|nr:hypothetical protein MAPG_05054 [Magnaporthiopsis poae ATCC 64411]